MTKTELARYRQILEAKQAELADVLKTRSRSRRARTPSTKRPAPPSASWQSVTWTASPT